MGFVCEGISQVNANYQSAQARYAQKRQNILAQLTKESEISGEQFTTLLQDKFAAQMEAKLTSPGTGREVGYQTIIGHIYDAARSMVYQALGEQGSGLDSIKSTIERIRQDTLGDLEKERELVAKEIDKAVVDFAKQMDLNAIFNKYLPQVMSSSNQSLSVAQIMGYCKSIFKQQIQRRTGVAEISKIFKRHPAIIMGYIREDALTKAASEVIEELQIKGASAKTVGAEQSKIDILISLGGAGSSMSGDLSGILSMLDNLGQNIEVTGSAEYDTSQFLGIQAKPWDLTQKTSQWNRNSIGSRADLKNDFIKMLESAGGIESYSWHTGVLYLSEHLEAVMGANTVMYATGKNIIWADDLLGDMISKYNKYFAFSLNSNHELTSHIVLADHYC